ncbi:MAG: HD domain-containing protein [bacterium]
MPKKKKTRREILEKYEKNYVRQKHGTLSKNTKGREIIEKEDEYRLPFERDCHRILHSEPFRRLRHKTQVFYKPKNDHICTRLDHSLYLASIATTIARNIGANIDLVYAISLGHDLGHAPFGHTGEKILTQLVSDDKKGPGDFVFKHELHSLRVVDYLAKLPPREGPGLNLSFEVRDGIVSHYGEGYPTKIEPNFSKRSSELPETIVGESLPATIEGCIVRLTDKIAYLGRDIEDADTANLIDIGDNSITELKELKSFFGEISNREIITRLTRNIIDNASLDSPNIGFDAAHSEALKKLYDFSVKFIYDHEKLNNYKIFAEFILQNLYKFCKSHIEDAGHENLSRPYTEKNGYYLLEILHEFYSYTYRVPIVPWRANVDFIAGMTDNFAISAFQEISIPQDII